MDLEIINHGLNLRRERFNDYLNFYLKSSMKTTINFIKYGFHTRKFNFFIFYDGKRVNSFNYNSHSIYYGVLEKDNYHIYLFGPDNDIQFNKIVPRIAISLNVHDYDNSGIVFANDVEGKEYLLMKLKFDSLGEHQKIVLNRYNDISEIHNEFYINLGCFDNHIEILRNLRNFISKIKVDKSESNCLILNSIKIPNEYIQLHGLPEDYSEGIQNIDLNKNIYCMYCGHEINVTYQMNKGLKNIVGENPDKCASCFSKVLISHFQSKIDEKFKSKLDLRYLAENKDLINFYIDLSETAGIIGRDDELSFNRDLSDFNKFFHEIPNNLIIEGNIMGNNKKKNKKQKNKLKIRKQIDKLTRKSSGRSYYYFEGLLKKYQLSYNDGQKIREILLDDLNEGKFNGSVKDRIETYVVQLANENKNTNLFKLSNKLNNLTLKAHNLLNDEYIGKLDEYSLTEEDGWKIRNEIIDKINNLTIVHPNTVEKRLNELIEKYGSLKQKDEEIVIDSASNIDGLENTIENQDNYESKIKEFYLINNYCHLDYVCLEDELTNIIKFLGDEDSITLESLLISKISKNVSKVSIECEILEDRDSFKKILIENNFKELIIK